MTWPEALVGVAFCLMFAVFAVAGAWAARSVHEFKPHSVFQFPEIPDDDDDDEEVDG